MPQSWEATCGELLNGEFAESRRAIVDSIGNLTLVTKKLNGKLSNAAWSKDGDSVSCKRKTIKKYSLMLLAKDVVEEPYWNDEKIAERSAALFDCAREIWPGPAVTDAPAFAQPTVRASL